MEDSYQQIEQWLQSEIESIERAINELLRDKETIERRLTTHRLGYSPDKGAKRKNSGQKIIVEGVILATLEKLKQTRSQVLFKEAIKSCPKLNPATFRGYLHRLKKRGLIESSLVNGRWRLPTKEPMLVKA